MTKQIAERPLEPPANQIFGECAQCCVPIFEGDAYYEVNGQYVHTDCFPAYAKDFFGAYEKEAEIKSPEKW